MNSMLFARHAFISDSLIGREALLISVSPRENFLNPPPVPDTPTVTRISPCSFLYSSATASVIGYTELDPSMLIRPLYCLKHETREDMQIINIISDHFDCCNDKLVKKFRKYIYWLVKYKGDYCNKNATGL